ncbi:ribosome small subunit-dependent GTPase A [Plantactinospora sp. WMMC1484]|uniref:ribosome small subunit-dependent GTPase A n=1 Tax=Plantactinospora sp. WMMC1484 TaxID=3404122 RepID=UPI003BF492D4
MSFDLASLGWDAALAAAHPDRGDDLQPGRVVRAERGICTLLGPHGTLRASLGGGVLAAAARDAVELPCAGDWVLVRNWPDQRLTVEIVLPRRTAIVRRTADKDSTGQVLAANADAAAVIEPLHPAPDVGRIERLLALAWESGATPLVVLTKCDLVADPAAVAADLARSAPGVEVLPVSAQRGTGLDRLRPWVAAGRTLALLGPSGAGKSTLVNALAGATVMTTQGVRGVDGKGRHTTTHRQLIPIPGGGAVLDTPGVRAVGLLDAAAGLDRAFADVAELVAACRFADCGHRGEPGCTVEAALRAGELSPRRWESWQKLQREVAYETRRRDARLAAVERHKWKRIRREQRSRGSGRT